MVNLSSSFDLFSQNLNDPLVALPLTVTCEEIDGIEFYRSRNECIESYNNLGIVDYFISFIKSIYNYVVDVFYYIGLFFSDYNQKIQHLSTLQRRECLQNKLVVALHGLNCTPGLFKNLINELNVIDDKNFDLYVPRIAEKGNVELDIAVKPILEEITNWAKKEGDLEIALVGISNGARIAKALDTELAKQENHGNIKKIHFISIAGAAKGSFLADLAHSLNLQWFMTDSISKEMPTKSMRSKKLHEDWVKAISESNNLKRSYSFIACAHDWIVPNFDSTLMDVSNQVASYAITLDHGHISVVNRVSKAVAKLIMREN